MTGRSVDWTQCQAADTQHRRLLLDAARVREHEASIVEKIDEVEIAERLGIDHSRRSVQAVVQLGAEQLLARPRMDREHDRDLAAESITASRTCSSWSGSSTVFGRWSVRTAYSRRREAEARGRLALARGGAKPEQRVDHRVADEIHAVGRDSFGLQGSRRRRGSW